MESVLWYMLAGARGGPNRIRILRALDEHPWNANQLAAELDLDYTTVRHHLDVLIEHDLVKNSVDGYGTMYALSDEGKPMAGSGVTAALETITRKDGSKQVAVAGHPLYTYAPDERPGDTNGQGVGGIWFVVAPDGSQISGAGTDTGGETTTRTGGGSTGGGTGGGY